MQDSTPSTNLGDLIAAYYDEFLAAYGDKDLASALTTQAVNDLLTEPAPAAVPLALAA
jgi:hypothetical protein